MPNQRDWPDELDALNAAQEFHTLLFENEAVRVLDTKVPPGQTTPLHTHRWPSALYILSGSEFVRRNQNGQTVLDSCDMEAISKGTALWSPPLAPHTWRTLAAPICT